MFEMIYFLSRRNELCRHHKVEEKERCSLWHNPPTQDRNVFGKDLWISHIGIGGMNPIYGDGIGRFSTIYQ